MFSGCNKSHRNFTEEVHIQRVSERIQARYIDGDEKLRPYDKPTDDGKIYPKYRQQILRFILYMTRMMSWDTFLLSSNHLAIYMC